MIEHAHDHDDDRLVETDHGTVIGTIYGDDIPPEIRRLIDDDISRRVQEDGHCAQNQVGLSES
jgi:hypothetical protein